MAAVCTAYGNQALKNSEIEYQYENVHIHVDEEYDEGTNVNSLDRLNWITYSQTAAALRDQYGADLVVDVFTWREKGQAASVGCQGLSRLGVMGSRLREGLSNW